MNNDSNLEDVAETLKTRTNPQRPELDFSHENSQPISNDLQTMISDSNLEDVAVTLKTRTKRSCRKSHSESGVEIPKKKSRRGNKNLPSCSQAEIIECDSVTCDSKQQSNSPFLAKKMRLCQSNTSHSNPNSQYLETSNTSVTEVDRNNQQRIMKLNDKIGDKMLGSKDVARDKTTQMISALPLKTKLPRIPKLPRQHITGDDSMTQLLTPNFG